MEKAICVHFGMDDKVVGVLYLSLLKDLLENKGCVLKGYSGPEKDLEDARRQVSPRTVSDQ